jgi:hypothetical protein
VFAIVFLVLAGLTAFAFLLLVWRRRQMPVILRAILIIGATAIVIYIGSILLAAFRT